jgi:FKBP-type peptidyl-prolyl cis-trans isomerase (trigger factor)
MTELRPQATERVKAALVLRQIIKVENIEVPEKDVDEEIDKLKKQYSQDAKAIESLSTPAYRRHVMSLQLNRIILEKLKEWNTKQKV